MLGFTGIISDIINLNEISLNYSSLNNIVTNKKVYKNFYIERFTNNKFLNDKLFADDENIFIAIEGIILNYKYLLNKYACSNYFNLIKTLYKQIGEDFFKLFKGEFSGVLYDKINYIYIIFTNQTGTKPIYYYNNKGTLIFSSQLKIITELLKKFKFNFTLDEEAAYFLLTYGYMLEDYTIIKEIKKLRPGNYIKVTRGNIVFNEYFTLQNEPFNEKNEYDIINDLDELFKNSISLQYDKDIENNYMHITTLSGGLDTRMNVMTAYELGYKNMLNITFSQSYYLDQVIAQKISKDLNNEFLFCSLDNGNCLKDIKNSFICNDGLVLYSGASHMLSALKKINFSQYGLLHTGQIGDAVLGSFLTSKKTNSPHINDGAYSIKLLGKIDNVFKKISQKYNSEEIFKFYNRAFNGALNGDWITNQFTESSSPFLEPEFLSYCLKIPPQLKYKEKIYIEWILLKHPNYAKYVWEKQGIRPTYSKLKLLNKKVFDKVNRVFKGENESFKMNPFDYWYKNNKGLNEFLNTYYNINKYYLDKYPELKRDCNTLFNEGNTGEKTQVITLLQDMKEYF